MKWFYFRLNLKRFVFELVLRYVLLVGNNIVGFIENNVYMEVFYVNVVLCLINLKFILKKWVDIYIIFLKLGFKWRKK